MSLERLGRCVYQENTIDKWDIPWDNPRENFVRYVGIVSNISSVTYASIVSKIDR